ncbi:M28 family peptidase [Pseudomarimonas salicorniae]|uniref:Carboxypeptidase Q n=1 Tax=Pseudomarimonas salicorniae TaxID=2933270 RepID=A0ABT0GKN4_9GAMM|nr:M28 family peptidase [Lysobacter sp. CAU 1642]MCK7594973.1 M28 family peptidase [Lysobacter sp. CAU 1642]
MRLQLSAATLLFTLVGAASASPRMEIAERLRDQAMAGSEGYAIVESLTTEIGPRLAGTEDEARAVAWAEAKLRELGYDKVWKEPVTIPLWLRRHERARVLGPFAQPLLITALGHSVGTEGPLRGEVVELPDLSALRAIDDDRLRGKIVFINLRMERHRDGAGYGKAADGRSEGPREAAARGARAFLLRSVGTDSHRFPHTGNTRRAVYGRDIPAAALSNPDADQLSRLLKRGPVEIEVDIDAGFAGEVVTHNVIGEVTGSEPDSGIVLIGAHLDSWDLGTGAVDDGAGIGITFAAGAAIAALEETPRRSVRVVAFAAEEVGLLGAKGYAETNAAILDRHVFAMESDFGAGRIHGFRAGIHAEKWPELERLAGVLAPLGIEVDRSPGGPGPDILPLWEGGVPWGALRQDGTDYFDYHHTADDTLDKIDPKALDQQVAAYAALTWAIADSDIDLRPVPPRASSTPAKPVATEPVPPAGS